MREINGYTIGEDGSHKLGKGFGDLKDDGTTACGGWIYSGVFAPTDEHPEGVNKAQARVKGALISPGWGFAWPANRHILYNRAAADPQGNPWPKEARIAQKFDPSGKSKGYVWWDANAETKNPDGTIVKGKWTGIEGETPDFPTTKAPTTPAKPNGVGLDFHSGADPFIMKADGKAWLYAPSGLTDGPLPTHYEPVESPVTNTLYPEHQNNPVYKTFVKDRDDYLAKVGDANFPHVLSTYRLTEHHLSGSMSRWLPWLAELQPELFVEISPELAQQKGIGNTQQVKVTTPRGTITAKALVTKRIRPFTINGNVVHQVGMPWHWGYKGIAQGDVVNDLAAMVGDPNVSIHEAKVFVCNIEPA
jgi:formate dehydrogenase major subunit